MSPTYDLISGAPTGQAPQDDRALPGGTPQQDSSRSARATPARLLVIDDDEITLKMISATLERAGHRVFVARHGKEGLALFESEQPDAVITDIFMPDQDGIEVITALARQRPGIRILAISGGSQLMELDYLGYARRLGAQGALAKPFAPSALIAAVERLLADLPTAPPSPSP